MHILQDRIIRPYLCQLHSGGDHVASYKGYPVFRSKTETVKFQSPTPNEQPPLKTPVVSFKPSPVKNLQNIISIPQNFNPAPKSPTAWAPKNKQPLLFFQLTHTADDVKAKHASQVQEDK